MFIGDVLVLGSTTMTQTQPMSVASMTGVQAASSAAAAVVGTVPAGVMGVPAGAAVNPGPVMGLPRQPNMYAVHPGMVAMPTQQMMVGMQAGMMGIPYQQGMGMQHGMGIQPGLIGSSQQQTNMSFDQL